MGTSHSPSLSGDRSSSERSSNIRAAINDGQWHSFGNAGSSARSSVGRNSGGSAHNSNLSARNSGSADGRWHSFGSSSGASQRGRVTSDFGVPLRGAPGFGRGGDGWGGGWRGYGWGRGWGWGGWGFGVGWPYWGFYWGPAWAFGWNPWWYGPYWYGAWPAYSYYPDYSYDWSDNPPPYRPDSSPNSSHDRDPSASVTPPNSDHSTNPSSNYDDNRFNLNPGSSPGNNGSVQDGQTPQPEAAPNSPAPTVQSPGTPGLAVFEPWAPVPAGLI
jgi:hypothetical protein